MQITKNSGVQSTIMGSQGGIVIVLYYNNITNHDWFFLVPTNFLNSNYMSDTGVCKLVISTLCESGWLESENIIQKVFVE